MADQISTFLAHSDRLAEDARKAFEAGDEATAHGLMATSNALDMGIAALMAASEQRSNIR